MKHLITGGPKVSSNLITWANIEQMIQIKLVGNFFLLANSISNAPIGN